MVNKTLTRSFNMKTNVNRQSRFSGAGHFGRLSVALALSLLLLAAGCGQPKSAAKKKAPPAVAVETVSAQDFTRVLRLTGSVEPTRVAALSSPAEGPVQNCSAREGDQVAAGDALLDIGRESSARASLLAAREEAERQLREFERVRSLVEDKALAAEQLDTARSNYEGARAAVAQAEQVSRDYQVSAPWAGIVTRVHVADGRYVAPRTPLIDLYDPESLVLRFHVPERDALAVKEGDTLEARFDALGERSFTLTINRAFPELDRQLRLRTFEAALPLDAAPFRPGLFARLEIALQREEGVLTVPVDALVDTPQGPAVFRIADQTATQVLIKTGFEQDGRVWVRSGLQVGDRVVVRGLEQLRDGSAVRIEKSDTNKRSAQN